MFRFGYDYQGGYERDNGGRPGYPDDRPHGRYMGRSSGGYQGGTYISYIFLVCIFFNMSTVSVFFTLMLYLHKCLDISFSTNQNSLIHYSYICVMVCCYVCIRHNV